MWVTRDSLARQWRVGPRREAWTRRENGPGADGIDFEFRASTSFAVFSYRVATGVVIVEQRPVHLGECVALVGGRVDVHVHFCAKTAANRSTAEM